MSIRRAADAFCFNAIINGPGKVGIFDHSGGLAWIIFQTFSFPGGLDPAIVHPKNKTVQPIVFDGLFINVRV
jgi:hypothetical protein